MSSASRAINDAYYELLRIAAERLDHPSKIPGSEELDRWRPRLRLWHYPSFEPQYSWSVHQTYDRATGKNRAIVRQVTWHYDLDVKRFDPQAKDPETEINVQPTMEVMDCPLDLEAFEERLVALGNIAFPAFAAQGMGFDGETYGISLPRYAKVEWWCEGPESWSGLTVWAAEMRQWLRELARDPLS